jgi:hypothetical protein
MALFDAERNTMNGMNSVEVGVSVAVGAIVGGAVGGTGVVVALGVAVAVGVAGGFCPHAASSSASPMPMGIAVLLIVPSL